MWQTRQIPNFLFQISYRLSLKKNYRSTTLTPTLPPPPLLFQLLPPPLPPQQPPLHHHYHHCNNNHVLFITDPTTLPLSATLFIPSDDFPSPIAATIKAYSEFECTLVFLARGLCKMQPHLKSNTVHPFSSVQVVPIKSLTLQLKINLHEGQHQSLCLMYQEHHHLCQFNSNRAGL